VPSAHTVGRDVRHLVVADQRFDHAHDQYHASMKLFAIEIVVGVLILLILSSLLYSEPPDSIPSLYPILLFRANSYVEAITHVQLKYRQIVRAHLRSSALHTVTALRTHLLLSLNSIVGRTPPFPSFLFVYIIWVASSVVPYYMIRKHQIQLPSGPRLAFRSFDTILQQSGLSHSVFDDQFETILHKDGRTERQNCCTDKHRRTDG
jgi:hypothetical protein